MSSFGNAGNGILPKTESIYRGTEDPDWLLHRPRPSPQIVSAVNMERHGSRFHTRDRAAQG